MEQDTMQTPTPTPTQTQKSKDLSYCSSSFSSSAQMELASSSSSPRNESSDDIQRQQQQSTPNVPPTPSASPSDSAHASTCRAFVGSGLKNLGNNCYMNAVLQCLTYTPPLVRYLQQASHSQQCKNQGFCAFCALREHVNTALSLPGKTTAAYGLFDKVSDLSSSASFKKYNQEDAHEYMHCLVEALHKCLLPVKASEQCLLLQGESFIKNLFGGQLKSQVKCSNCSHSSEVFEPLIDLSLDIEESDSIAGSLQSFTAEEVIDCGSTYRCEHCKENASVKKRMTIDVAPEVLLIHFKRFSSEGFHDFHGIKSNKDVRYPNILDLEQYTSSTQHSKDLEYELYGVVVHHGLTMGSGHYYSFVQTSPGIWHKFDDSMVTAVDIAVVLEQQAYLLLYFRKTSMWFSHLSELTSKYAPIESPKSVLQDSNVSDDSESSDKVSSKMPIKEQSFPEVISKPDSTSCSDQKIEDKLDHLDADHGGVSPNQEERQRCADTVGILSASPSLLDAKCCISTQPSSPNTATKEKLISETVQGKTKQWKEVHPHLSGSKSSTGRKFDQMKCGAKRDRESSELPKESDLIDAVSPKSKNTSSSPCSLNKVLSGMPSKRRNCFMTCFEEGVAQKPSPKMCSREVNSYTGRKKRISHIGETADAKRPKQTNRDDGIPTMGQRSNFESAMGAFKDKQGGNPPADDNPYSLDFEIEEIV